MSIAEANLELPPNFTGVVKLFPLPNLVLFPGVYQPLHIFEPRYRKLLEDSLNSDQLIALATLTTDDDSKNAKPEIHPTICIGKVVSHAQLPDGRFNLVLMGAQRAKIIREIPSTRPYRMADVKVLKPERVGSDHRDHELRSNAIQLFERLVADSTELDREFISHLANDDLPLGLLMDMLTFSCGANLTDQQQVLETNGVHERANLVMSILRSLLGAKQLQEADFPPRFSLN